MSIEEFEIENGLLGMKRDIILRLVTFMFDNSIANVFGMDQNVMMYKTHPYFERFPIYAPISMYKKIYKAHLEKNSKNHGHMLKYVRFIFQN